MYARNGCDQRRDEPFVDVPERSELDDPPLLLGPDDPVAGSRRSPSISPTISGGGQIATDSLAIHGSWQRASVPER